MSTRFEWDRTKAAINLRKHAISFDIAVRVFADPLALTVLDENVGGEQRWQTLGLVEGQGGRATNRGHSDYFGPSGRPEREATL